MNEFSIIKKYLSPLTKGHKGTFNLGDDIYYDHEKRLAISFDTYNQGTHFINFKEPNLVIKKTLRSSISELLSNGVSPISVSYTHLTLTTRLLV